MSFVLSTAVISRSSSALHWGQASVSGAVFIVVEIKGEKADESGKKALVQLQKNLTEKIPTTLADLRQRISGFDLLQEVQYLIGVLSGDDLLMVAKNTGSVAILRGGKSGSILGENGAVTGKVQPQDQIVLSNASFAQSIRFDQLISVVKDKKVSEAKEDLGSLLAGVPNSTAAAAIIIRVGDVQENSTLLGDNGGQSDAQEKQMPILQTPTSTSHSQKKLSMFFSSIQEKLAQVPNLVRRYSGGFSNDRKAALTITTMLIAVLGASILFGLQSRNKAKQEEVFVSALEEAAYNFEEAMALIDLNPIRSRELLAKAGEVLGAMTAEESLSKKQQEQVDDLNEKISGGLIVASKSFDVGLAQFLDLDLVKTGGTAVTMALYQDRLALLDVVNNAVYQVSPESKAAAILFGGEELDGAKSITMHGDTVYVLTDKGILLIGEDAKKTRIIIEENENWGDVAMVSAYAGNLYLLDRGKNQIWKYVTSDNGFSDIRKYLAPDTFPDLSDSTSMAINGSIWVGKGTSVLQFTHGAPQSFSLSGLDNALGSRARVFISDTVTSLYVLDTQNKRVVAFDTDGVYQAQYNWSEDVAIDDFVVSESARKILLLSGSNIYEIALK